MTMETVLPYHHAVESALRIYVAHVAQPEAPWIDLASRRSPREFTELVRTEFVATNLDPRQVAQVCWGSLSAPPDQDPDEWSAAVAGLRSFLRSFR